MRSDRRLPEDPAYWEDLAARSVSAAFRSPALAAPSAWWWGMSDAAFVLAASAVFAVVGGSLLLDQQSARAPIEASALTGALAPQDPMLVTLANARGEPAAFDLFKLIALREGAR